MNFRSGIIVILFAIVAFSLSFSQQEANGNVYNGDVAGYYFYLPATFIDHDVFFANLYVERYPNDCGWLHVQANGKRLNKYTIGVSLMSIPFFAAAHAYASANSKYLPDGYSYPYQVAGRVASIFYTLFGLILLSLFLKNYYRPVVTAVVLCCIAFGTNLYYYAIYEPGMSHPFSFFLFAAMLLLTYSWYKTFRPRHLLLLAFVSGLIILVRPVNITVLALPLFWSGGGRSLRNNITEWTKRKRLLFLSLLLFFIPVFLQLCYWHHITGYWLINSYEGEHFKFSDPRIINGLFSFRKGWFVYTPIAFVGFTGFFFHRKKNRNMTQTLLILFAVVIYITFSWRPWWYGGSFGCRPLIEYLVLLALPLGAFLEFISSKNLFSKGFVFLLITGMIGLNIFQSYQYSNYMIHFDRMSKAAYFKVWGRTDISFEEYEPYLISERDYWNELKRHSEE